jgi:uncharacterized protein
MNKLIFPQELEVWYLLPAIRKRVALGLIKKGMPQKKIAELMFVSGAAISQYKKSKRANDNFLGIKFDDRIDYSVQKIFQNNSSFFSEMMQLNSLIKDTGILCVIHKIKETGNIACNGCELNNGVCM